MRILLARRSLSAATESLRVFDSTRTQTLNASLTAMIEQFYGEQRNVRQMRAIWSHVSANFNLKTHRLRGGALKKVSVLRSNWEASIIESWPITQSESTFRRRFASEKGSRFLFFRLLFAWNSARIQTRENHQIGATAQRFGSCGNVKWICNLLNEWK